MSAAPPRTPAPPHPTVWNVPNALSFARIPLAVVLFVLIVHAAWGAALLVFCAATATDWMDGWWARRYGVNSPVGRNLDPMTDKVLVCGAFVYLIGVEHAGIEKWMVTLVVCRELIVSTVRGIVEATGQTFGADWFGKLKMVLQCAVLIGVFLLEWLRAMPPADRLRQFLEPIQFALIWAMLAATLGSGLKYLVKAARMLH